MSDITHISCVILDPANRHQLSYRVILDGELLPHAWISRGAAEAGLIVERKRKTDRQAREQLLKGL